MAAVTLSFEQLWAMFQEVAKEQKEAAILLQKATLRSQELDKHLKELSEREERRSQDAALRSQEAALRFQDAALRSQELDKHLKELSEREERRSQEAVLRSQELNKVIDRLEKNLGGLGNSMGELIETLIASRLWEKFAGYPYNLQRAYRRIPIYNTENRIITDIDILLADSEWVMAVEVKREPDKDDIDHHIKRMGRIVKYPPAEVKGKKLLGAIAGGAVDPDIHDYAHQIGFFILELKGESVALVPPPPSFSPRTW